MRSTFLSLTAAAMTLGASFSTWAAQATCNTNTGCELPSGGDSVGSARRTDTRVYFGLNWQLNGKQGWRPDLVVGLRSLQVKSTDSVMGSDLSVKLSYDGHGVAVDSARLLYVGGRRDLQGEAGLGYSFARGGVLGTVAAQASYVRIGADYVFSGAAFLPFAEINTMARPKKVQQSTSPLSCASGLLTDVTTVTGFFSSVDPTVIKAGQTCLLPT